MVSKNSPRQKDALNAQFRSLEETSSLTLFKIPKRAFYRKKRSVEPSSASFVYRLSKSKKSWDCFFFATTITLIVVIQTEFRWTNPTYDRGVGNASYWLF